MMTAATSLKGRYKLPEEAFTVRRHMRIRPTRCVVAEGVAMGSHPVLNRMGGRRYTNAAYKPAPVTAADAAYTHYHRFGGTRVYLIRLSACAAVKERLTHSPFCRSAAHLLVGVHAALLTCYC
jgi:hypothetical protein